MLITIMVRVDKASFHISWSKMVTQAGFEEAMVAAFIAIIVIKRGRVAKGNHLKWTLHYLRIHWLHFDRFATVKT